MSFEVDMCEICMREKKRTQTTCPHNNINVYTHAHIYLRDTITAYVYKRCIQYKYIYANIYIEEYVYL